MTEKLLRLVFVLALLLSMGVVHADPIERQITDLEVLRAAALAQAAKSLSFTGSGQHLEVGPIDPRLRLARCATPIQAGVGPSQQTRDRVLVALRCQQPKVWQVYVPVRVVGSRTALRTRRAVVAGEVLQSTDVEKIAADVEQMPIGAVDADIAVGKMTAAHALTAGAVLTTRDLIFTRAVEKGQTVLLVGKGPSVEVKMSAIALDNAYLNQRVKVRNASSGRLIEGFARAPGIVEVVLPGL